MITVIDTTRYNYWAYCTHKASSNTSFDVYIDRHFMNSKASLKITINGWIIYNKNIEGIYVVKECHTKIGDIVATSISTHMLILPMELIRINTIYVKYNKKTIHVYSNDKLYFMILEHIP